MVIRGPSDGLPQGMPHLISLKVKDMVCLLLPLAINIEKLTCAIKSIRTDANHSLVLEMVPVTLLSVLG